MCCCPLPFCCCALPAALSGDHYRLLQQEVAELVRAQTALEQQRTARQEQERALAARTQHESALAALTEQLDGLALSVARPRSYASALTAGDVLPSVAAAVARPALQEDQVQYLATQLAELQSTVDATLATCPMSSQIGEALGRMSQRCDMLMAALLGAS